jgi:hypothetical protein
MLLTGWLDKTLGIYFANGCGGATAFRSAYKSKGSSGHCVIEAIRLLESRLPGLDNLSCLMKVGRERADAWLTNRLSTLLENTSDRRWSCAGNNDSSMGAVPHMIRGSEILAEPIINRLHEGV